jgi:uncharacterized protein YkwD
MCIAVLATVCACACAGSSIALAAHSRAHARAHRAGRCGKAARTHGRRGHASKRSKRRRARSSCLERHRSFAKHRTKRIAHTKTTGSGTATSRTKSRSQSAAYTSDGCANALLEPNEQNLESIRAATLCLVNHERSSHGESPLRANPRLQQAAQGHTESMVEDNYFEHLGPGGETPLQRMRAAGYIYSSRVGYAVGENIAWGTLWLGTPHAVVAAWMASPGHRANILDAQYRDSGIGVSPHPPSSLSHGQGGGIYTQDFGVISAG